MLSPRGNCVHDDPSRAPREGGAGLGLTAGDSAIVFCDVEGAAERLERAGIRSAVRGGRLRTSWHVYNTDEDVERALDVLVG